MRKKKVGTTHIKQVRGSNPDIWITDLFSREENRMYLYGFRTVHARMVPGTYTYRTWAKPKSQASDFLGAIGLYLNDEVPPVKEFEEIGYVNIDSSFLIIAVDTDYFIHNHRHLTYFSYGKYPYPFGALKCRRSEKHIMCQCPTGRFLVRGIRDTTSSCWTAVEVDLTHNYKEDLNA